MSESKPWAIYYKQATENVQDINSSLLKHIEFVENENIKSIILIIIFELFAELKNLVLKIGITS